MKLAVSAVIPYFRGARDIRACIESLLSSEAPPREIIVVDNCPEGVPADALPSTDKLKVIRSRPSIGFGRACNIGIMEALRGSPDAILLFNQDARLLPGCLNELSTTLEEEKDAAAATGFSMTYDGEAFSDQWFSWYVERYPSMRADFITKNLKRRYAVSASGASAACVLIRSTVFTAGEFFDPLIHMYGEDGDLFARIIRRGWKVFLVPGARFAHRHSNFSASPAVRALNDARTRFGWRLHQIRTASPVELVIRLLLIFPIHNYVLTFVRGRPLFSVLMVIFDLRFLLCLPQALMARRPARFKAFVEAAYRRDIAQKK